ncbi:hypothetical protein PVAP13_3KG511103 [Panicum virgatum]|uniref:Uncharacterized protein n=1 Tax=Panicum virgatum TaxID=38727 RepID=A0A8T0VDM7_PANVG|nr:hypothetical protein PVAP13_3KG511103 [Panicum virgatum]
MLVVSRRWCSRVRPRVVGEEGTRVNFSSTASHVESPSSPVARDLRLLLLLVFASARARTHAALDKITRVANRSQSFFFLQTETLEAPLVFPAIFPTHCLMLFALVSFVPWRILVSSSRVGVLACWESLCAHG